MPRTSGRAALPILGRVFILVGSLLLLLSGAAIAHRANDLAGTRDGEGVVVANRRYGQGFSPVVEYTPEGGRPTRFETSFASRPPAYHVGERVPLRYHAERPADARINSFWQLWLLAAIFALVALPFMTLGVIFTLASMRR